MVGESTDHIKIARADFVESCNASGEKALLVGNVESESLTDIDVCSNTGGEIIVSTWIAVGFLRPEFIAEHGVKI
jgi:hypothetical protein